MLITHAAAAATPIPATAARTPSPSRTFFPGEPCGRRRCRLRSRCVMGPGQGTHRVAPPPPLGEHPGRAEDLVSSFAKLRLLGAGLRSLRVAATVDLDPNPLGGHLGDLDGANLGRLERHAGATEVGPGGQPDGS